jgi:hypothetical protein
MQEERKQNNPLRSHNSQGIIIYIYIYIIPYEFWALHFPEQQPGEGKCHLTHYVLLTL